MYVLRFYKVKAGSVY